MSIFIAKGQRKKSDGSWYRFYILKETSWDTKKKAVKQRYVAYLGIKPTITDAKARAICKKIGIALPELKAVRGLKIKD